MGVRVWLGGAIITMDPRLPRARALVERDGIIDYVGDEAGAIARGGDGAELRHLGGRAVVPGFNDNHVHAVFMGDHELAIDLGGLGSREIVRLLKERFPAPGPGTVIRAFNWDYPACPDPSKELLDEAFPRNPVVLNQFSGHAQWLNSAALRILGISRGSPDPRQGSVLRGPDGEPTGIVRDLGDTKLSKKRSRDVYFDAAMREERLDLALSTFSRMGITSIQDNSWYYPELLSLRRRLGRGELPLRVTAWSLGRRPRHRAAMDTAFALGVGVRDWIREGPVKYFLDGTFSTRNACLCEPFMAALGAGGVEDEGALEPGARPGRASTAAAPAAAPTAALEAELCEDPEAPLEELGFLARKGRQGAFHIIGDRGIAIFLDAYESVLARYPKLPELRIRIEHAQLIRPEDIPRIARLRVLVSAQPTALGSPEKDVLLLGRDRARRAYPYRSLLDAGVSLSFGSDIPGESGCDPIRSIHMAVNREGPERIEVDEALRCYTVGSAYAEFAEGRKGMIKPGMLADFVVLSQDLTAVPREKIGDTVVEETVVGGRTVYSKA